MEIRDAGLIVWVARQVRIGFSPRANFFSGWKEYILLDLLLFKVDKSLFP
jgi:hypothetical protein